MPSARSSRAPQFNGGEDEVLSEFLREYEDLADGFRLTEAQKVETIMRYIPRTLRSLWMTLPGCVGTTSELSWKFSIQMSLPTRDTPSRVLKHSGSYQLSLAFTVKRRC